MFAKFSKAYGVITENHIGIVDGVIRDVFKYDGKEKERVVNYFRYGKESEDKYMNQKSDDIEVYLKVLKCTMGDSLYDIKRSYRKLVQEYHPDKYANLPKFVVECATEKFRELQEAYEYVQTRYKVE